MPEGQAAGQLVREIEHKFRVHSPFRLPAFTDLAVSVHEVGTVTLGSTYFDTHDLRLAREGITLRRRTGGTDEGWHLKLPVADAAAGVRDEYQVPLAAADPDRAPDLLIDLVLAIVRTDPIEPVASLRTERTIRLLTDEAGNTVAELVDDSVQVVEPGRDVAARFRELELEERAAATSELVGRISQLLISAGANGGEFVSKAVRALGPAATTPPEVPELDPPGPGEPARLAVTAYLSRFTRGLRAADLGVRRDIDDSVHKLRVAARRLRSGLRVFRPLLDREWADALRADLSWVASGLGRYRDTEVLLSRLEPGRPMAAEPGRQVLRSRLTERMADARADALQILRSERYLDLHARLVDACAAPVTTPGAELPSAKVLPPLVAKAWRRFSHGAEELLREEQATTHGASDESWHAVRIAAKRVRYAAEAVVPVLGPDAAAFAKAMSEVTAVLGDHQDAAHAAAVAEQVAATADPPLAFALGVLCGVERAHVTSARADFATLWPKVSKEKLRQWFET